MEPCIFHSRDKNSGRVSMMLGVHVDDMIVVGHDVDCDSLCAHIRESCPANKLGELKYYTGCSFTRENDTLKSSQDACIAQLIEN